VVTIVFWNVFARKYIKINFFYFLKIIINISTLKRSENTKKKLTTKKKIKKFNFLKNTFKMWKQSAKIQWEIIYFILYKANRSRNFKNRIILK